MFLKSYERDATLIFLHMPKAGGNTIRLIIKQHYPDDRVFNFGADPYVIRETFLAMSSEQRQYYRLVAGHFHFGIHAYVNQPYHYITMLRDPVDRVISTYYYIRENPNHYLYAYVIENNLSLHDFVAQRKAPDLDNLQMRLLLDQDDGYVSNDYRHELTDELYEQALARIERDFIWVGLAERFDASILLLGKLLGWTEPPYYVRANVTLNRPAKSEVSQATRQLISETNHYDVALYETAQARFDRDLQVAGITPTDVAKFTEANAKNILSVPKKPSSLRRVWRRLKGLGIR
jgi:hypothetical protein